MELIKYLFSKIWWKIKLFFLPLNIEYKQQNYVSEFDSQPEKITNTEFNSALSTVSPENPIFMNLKKIVDAVSIKNLTDIVNFFIVCYDSRLNSNWSDVAIEKYKNKEFNNRTDTVGRMNSRLFYKALRAFFGGMGCKVLLNREYYTEDVPTEMSEEDLNKAIVWTITEMSSKWLQFITCETLTDAISLIFRERKKVLWEVSD